jgi:hypothetical protein
MKTLGKDVTEKLYREYMESLAVTEEVKPVQEEKPKKDKKPQVEDELAGIPMEKGDSEEELYFIKQAKEEQKNAETSVRDK